MYLTARSRNAALVCCAALFLVTPAFGLVDVDGDGYPSDVDCDDLDFHVWRIPEETTSLRFDSDKTTLFWDPPLDPGGTAVLYDTLRTSVRHDFACDTAECTDPDGLVTDSADPTLPPPGAVFYYVSRAENSCGAGTIGSRSNGARRAALSRDCENLCNLTNSDFEEGLLGWILEGDEGCTISVPVIADDALHGDAFPLVDNLPCGGLIRLWQVAAVDVDAQSSVRVRVDVKLMYGGSQTGPLSLRVYAGVAPFYDQTLIGDHVFDAGSLAETTALNGTTTLPVGTWYAYTSDDIRPLIPAGTQFLRIELLRSGSGWGRMDNVKVVLNDAAVPAGTASPDPASGHPPLLVQLTGTCSDGDGVCVGTGWDFGDGPLQVSTPGGGGTSLALSPSHVFTGSTTYHASLTIEDDRGAARSMFATIAPENLAPTASIEVAPASGPAPLDVQFTAVTSDDHLIASYAWDFGDGAASAAVNPMHTYGSAGTYLAQLTVTDDHGATATAYHAVVAAGAPALQNGDFAVGTAGWALEGDEGCTISVPVIADDALHGDAFPLVDNLPCGGLIRLWQVAAVDVDAQSSVRVRVDVKLMYGGSQTGPLSLRVYAGVAPFYDQTLIGDHVFDAGSLAETTALNGTTTLPVGTWYAYTSDDIRPLIPAGTQFLRIELLRSGNGWGRMDNVKVVLNDAAVPAGTASPDPASGHPPLLVQLTGTCSDGDGVCVGTGWDFGDGPLQVSTPGGGGTSLALSPSHVFTGSTTYHASLTIEDDRGAARSMFATIAPENLAPTASIEVAPASGPAPLDVQFTAVTSDDHLIASYAWDFGDGAASAAVNPMHTYGSAGTYLAQLTVTDDHGATATAYHAVVAAGAPALQNGDFAVGTAGWALEGDEGCTISVPVIADDALHGDAFPLVDNLPCGGLIRLWQVAAVDVDAQSSVRVRVDVKLMYGGSQTGPLSLRVYAGVAPFYDQTLIGDHVFDAGSLAETTALNGTTTLPVGTWYAYTSDDIRPLIPAGTQFLRVELLRSGSGWGRMDNVKVVLNDAAVPAGGFTANPTNGSPPLLVQFSSSCSDGDGVCVGTGWDFGDGPTQVSTPGGGATSTSASPSHTFTDSLTYHVSLTVEDDLGAAQSTLSSVSTTANVPPTVSIQAVPSFGDAPLEVQFTALASDSDGSIVSWAWNFGDGQTSTMESPLHTYGQPGTFQVTLSVTDDQGAFATAQYTIVVTVP